MESSYIDEVTGEIVHFQVTEALITDENEAVGIEGDQDIAEEEPSNEKSLAQFISLINDFDSQTVLQAVGPKLFDHFTVWDLLMAKSNLHLDKGVLNMVVDDVLVVLSELKIMIEQCLDPVQVGEVAIKKRNGESVKFDQMITYALGLDSHMWMKRTKEDVSYTHPMFSHEHLFSDKKKDSDFSKVRVKKEKDSVFGEAFEPIGNDDDEEEEPAVAEEKVPKTPPKKRRRKKEEEVKEDEENDDLLTEEEKASKEASKTMEKVEAEDEDFELEKESPVKSTRRSGRKRKGKHGSAAKIGLEEIGKKGDYICGKCNKTYMNFTAWYKHMEKTCASRASLRVSIRTVSGKYYCAYENCNTPKKPFRTKDDVHDHWALNHVEESKKIIPCFMCSLKFATVGAKKLHMNKVHVKAAPASKENKEKVEIEDDNDESEDAKAKERYLCLKCGQSMNKERGKKHEEKCNGMYVRKPEYKKVNDEFFCTVEGCNIGFGFSSMYGLRKHFHGMHTSEEEKFFLCDYCDDKFSFKTMRNKHITEKHLKKYVCDLCGKGFGGRSSMMQHRILHTGEKPFGCTTCEYRAAKKSNLEAHMESKHNIFRQKNFMCAICNKQFVTMGRVQRHMNEIHGEGAEEKKRKRGRAPPAPSLVDLANAQIIEEVPDEELQQTQEEQLDEDSNSIVQPSKMETEEVTGAEGEEVEHQVLIPVIDENQVVQGVDAGDPETVQYLQADLGQGSETVITVRELYA